MVFIVWGTGILLYAFAVNFWTFLPAMVFMALGLALISGAPSAWLVDQMIRHGIYEERNPNICQNFRQESDFLR